MKKWQRFLQATGLLILTLIMVRESALFYLTNGAAFWLVILSFGLYLLLFILPFIQVFLPFIKPNIRPWLTVIALGFSLGHGLLIWQYQLPYIYLDEGGVGKATFSQGVRWLALASAAVLLLIDMGYLHYDRAWSRFWQRLQKVNHRWHDQRVRSPQQIRLVWIKRYLFFGLFLLPYVLLAVSFMLIYVLTIVQPLGLPSWLLPILSTLTSLLLQLLAYWWLLPALRAAHLQRLLGIPLSSPLVVILLSLLAVRAGQWGGLIVTALALLLGPYLILPAIALFILVQLHRE